ncbi:uncharacterized protein LOC135827145 [Sycon ciliatum]|uniref:uncharacterized protein LOC135827145 n=1 Tax=Sycon ciliatum TaxID=27933 RepID=UPI0031F66046
MSAHLALLLTLIVATVGLANASPGCTGRVALSIPNAQIDHQVSPATFTCDDGLHLHGTNSTSCSNGRWSAGGSCISKCRTRQPINFPQQPHPNNGSQRCGETAADIIVVFDESTGPANSPKDRLVKMVSAIDRSLEERGIGLLPKAPNRYTLVAFGSTESPRVLTNNADDKVYDVQGFSEACQGLKDSRDSGATRNGYGAIQFAFNNITDLTGKQLLRLRKANSSKNANIAPILLFISDHAPDFGDSPAEEAKKKMRSCLKKMLRRAAVHMEVFVSNTITIPEEPCVFGVDAAGKAYLCGSAKRWSEAQHEELKAAVIQKSQTYRYYTSAALEVGGTLWQSRFFFSQAAPNASLLQALAQHTVVKVEQSVHACCTCRCSEQGLQCNVAASAAQCKAPQCIIPQIIKNGQRQYENRYMQQATYTCKPGFHLSGPAVLTCQKSGQWRNDNSIAQSTTAAKPKCTECNHTSNDNIVAVSPEGMVTCKPGYEYRDPQPVCTGVHTISSCTQCNYNGSAIDHIASISQNGSVTCMYGYNYTGPQPVCTGTHRTLPCKRITCEDYPRVPHAGFAVPAPYVGETINYQCVPGHVQFGAITVSCQENGHWQRPGFCKKIPLSGYRYCAKVNMVIRSNNETRFNHSWALSICRYTVGHIMRTETFKDQCARIAKPAVANYTAWRISGHNGTYDTSTQSDEGVDAVSPSALRHVMCEIRK